MRNWATPYEMLITEVLEGLPCPVSRTWKREDRLSDNFNTQEREGYHGGKGSGGGR